jgi:ammonium transporter Rh
MFNKIGDVWVMTFMVMFLMMMVKKFEWGVARALILCIVSSYLVDAFIYYFHIVNPIAKEECPTDDIFCYSSFETEKDYMMMMLQAKSIICAITLLIAVGSFVGTLKLCQYLVVGALFACCYYLNE